jgi:peptide/nickel transport system permease protein
MARFVLRRLLWTVVVLWAVVTITFAATFFSPIDPAAVYAGQRATPAQIEAVREKFGLDQPIYVQYAKYIGRVVQGDLGHSFVSGESVRELIAARLPDTIVLAAAAMFVQLLIGLPLGLLSALRRGTVVDRAILGLSLIGVAAPAFVVGFLLLYLLAFKLGWFPLGGAEGVASIVLPAVTLGIAGAAWYARMLRSTTLNILNEDYVRMARSKGLSETVIVRRHVVRNALGPIVTMIALDLGVFLGGVLIIEKVFAWPGIGLQAWQGLQTNDAPVVLGTVLVTALFVVLLNFLADVVNGLLDPRTRYG